MNFRIFVAIFCWFTAISLYCRNPNLTVKKTGKIKKKMFFCRMFQQLHNGSGYIPEMEQIISQLERGTLVTKFSWRVKSEIKKLAIRRETRELIWTRSTTSTSSSTSKPTFEGCWNKKKSIFWPTFSILGTIDLAEIKEVRVGKNSRDFDKWPDDTKLKETKCFVVFYGSEFKLRSLSIAGRSCYFRVVFY